jgi:hypothetical protein
MLIAFLQLQEKLDYAKSNDRLAPASKSLPTPASY